MQLHGRRRDHQAHPGEIGGVAPGARGARRTNLEERSTGGEDPTLAGAAHEEISLPVAGDGAVLCLGRPRADPNLTGAAEQ